MKVNLEAGKPRAVYAHTVERVDGGWKATIVLSNRLGVILERHVVSRRHKWRPQRPLWMRCRAGGRGAPDARSGLF